MKNQKYNFYFSAKQKQLEQDFQLDNRNTICFFKEREYTECMAVGGYDGHDIRPHGERFPDSVFLGTGTHKDVRVEENN